jgi:hypothetical protein
MNSWMSGSDVEAGSRDRIATQVYNKLHHIIEGQYCQEAVPTVEYGIMNNLCLLMVMDHGNGSLNDKSEDA